jgi:hypothetical protein
MNIIENRGYCFTFSQLKKHIHGDKAINDKNKNIVIDYFLKMKSEEMVIEPKLKDFDAGAEDEE